MHSTYLQHRSENYYEKPPKDDIPTNQQPLIHTNPTYSNLDPAPLQSAEQPVTADTTYEAIDLEDCQPHLKAQDEEPHIYEEIPKHRLGGTEYPPARGRSLHPPSTAESGQEMARKWPYL